MSPRGASTTRSRATHNDDDDDDDDDFDNIQIQPREYGYAQNPFTWDQLINIIEKEQNLAKLSRSVEQQKTYEIYRRKLLREWKSVYDHILVSKFGLEKRLVENPEQDGRNSTLWEAYPPLSAINEVRKALRPNDFPYYMPDHIEHWCLWKLSEDVTEKDIEHAKQDLHDMHGDVEAFTHWRNPPHLKSLPDIDHVHILCLRTKNENPER